MILVAGGAGFIGGALCERLLLLGKQVLCIDSLYTGSLKKVEELSKNPNFTFIKHNIIDPIELKEYGIKEIYNLACPASPDHYQKDEVYTLDTNYLGTKNLLELAVEHSAKFLLTSTSEIYGDPLVTPQHERYFGNVNTIGPRSCYDEGKRVAESLVYSYAKKYGIDAKVARLFNTYGPGMQINDGRAISNFIIQALTKQPIVIYGDGRQTRSLCYVDDTVSGLLALMNSDYNLPVNLGKDNELEINEIASIVFQILNLEPNIIYKNARQDDPLQRRPCVRLAYDKLGWHAETDLSTGLNRTIDYFKKELVNP